MVIALLCKAQTTNAGIIPQDTVPVYSQSDEILKYKPRYKMKRRFTLS